MDSRRPGDDDRLPWLEPYRETKTPGKPLPRRGYGKPFAYGLGAALLVSVGAGGYWLGQQEDGTTAPKSSQTIALQAPKPQPVEVAEVPPVEPAPVVEPPASEPAKVTKPKPTKKKAVRKRAPRKKIRTAGVESERINAVRAAQEKAAAAAPTPAPQPRQPARVWPKMPSPGPAGQVIQLGAFTTATRASFAYQQRVARYPALARMPRVIVPVATKPGNRVLYVLRLGTSSRQQSKTVCRNLRRSGDHCLVIG